MQTRRDNRKVRFAFDSLPELGRFIEGTKRDWSANASELNPRSESWDLKVGFEGAVRLAQDGWIEGAQRMQRALDRLPPATTRPDLRNDFYGHTPNVPRFCAGAPDSMIRHATDANSGAGRVLTLYVPVNANGDVDAPSMANFGLGVVQYINQLEASGTRVELHGATCSNVVGVRVTHTFKLKSADQSLDLAVLAFAIGHPAMFRRLGFAVRERSNVREDRSYGRAQVMELGDIIDAPQRAIILNGMKEANVHAKTPEAALKYITKRIEAAIAETELKA